MDPLSSEYVRMYTVIGHFTLPSIEDVFVSNSFRSQNVSVSVFNGHSYCLVRRRTVPSGHIGTTVGLDQDLTFRSNGHNTINIRTKLIVSHSGIEVQCIGFRFCSGNDTIVR